MVSESPTSDRRPRVSIILPAYNESTGVMQTVSAMRQVVAELRRTHAPVEVIFVDDGSKDDTESLLRKATVGDESMRVVGHGANQGLGAAIRTGFQHAKGDIIVTTDFDGTYGFGSIPGIIARLESSGADVVTASPYHRDGAVEGVPGYRLLFSFGASLLYRILVNPRIATWTALFRAYRRPVVESVRFESSDFLAGTELLVRAIQQGFRVAEYPTVLRTRTFGQSSIKIARVTRAHLRFQAQLLRETAPLRVFGMTAIALALLLSSTLLVQAGRQAFGRAATRQ